MNDEEMIRDLIGMRVTAMRNKDAPAAVSLLSTDIVAFELTPPLQHGPTSARDVAGLGVWFSVWSGPLEVEVRDLEVFVGGEFAFSHSLNRLSGTRTDGSSVDFWMRSTLGFRKVADRWEISHGHTSVPFHVDGSFRAAMDLQP